MRRVLQISDVHFGPPQLPAPTAGVFELVRRRNPDLIVLAGDLTQRAKPWQFAQALDFVAALEQRAPVLVVPGNHDVPLYRFWERVFDPYGAYRRHFSNELEPVFRDDELFVVGINTAYGWTTSHGRVTSRSLRRAEQRLAAVRDERGLCRIAVAHHPLLDSPALHGQRLVRRAAATAKMLAEQGVELLLSGHVHHFHSGLLGTSHAGLQRDVLVLHSGTATSNRGRPPESGSNSCIFLEIHRDEIGFERLGWQPMNSRFESEASFTYARSGDQAAGPG